MSKLLCWFKKNRKYLFKPRVLTWLMGTILRALVTNWVSTKGISVRPRFLSGRSDHRVHGAASWPRPLHPTPDPREPPHDHKVLLGALRRGYVRPLELGVSHKRRLTYFIRKLNYLLVTTSTSLQIHVIKKVQIHSEFHNIQTNPEPNSEITTYLIITPLTKIQKVSFKKEVRNQFVIL